MKHYFTGLRFHTHLEIHFDELSIILLSYFVCIHFSAINKFEFEYSFHVFTFNFPTVYSLQISFFTEDGTDIKVTIKDEMLNVDLQNAEKERHKVLCKKLLYVKDTYHIPDVAYRELSMVPGSNLPPLSHIIAERQEENEFLPIELIPQVTTFTM